jgi:hypothetical protein
MRRFFVRESRDFMAFSLFIFCCRVDGIHRTSAVYAQRRQQTQFPLRVPIAHAMSRAMPWFHRTQEIRDAVTTATESSPRKQRCTLQCGIASAGENPAPDALQGVPKAAQSRRLGR